MSDPVRVEYEHVTYLVFAAAVACAADQRASRMLFDKLYDRPLFMPLVLACGIYDGRTTYSDEAADALFSVAAALLEAEGRLTADEDQKKQVEEALGCLAYYAAARMSMEYGVIEELPGHEDSSIFDVTPAWFRKTELAAVYANAMALPAADA